MTDAEKNFLVDLCAAKRLFRSNEGILELPTAMEMARFVEQEGFLSQQAVDKCLALCQFIVDVGVAVRTERLP